MNNEHGGKYLMKRLYRFFRNYKYKLRNKKYKINPYSYSYLCSQLSKIEHIESIKFYDHYNNSEHNNKRILIRHDVDLDPWTALEMAKIENKYGLKATYYFLHSAKYYKKKISETLDIAKEIQNLDHEIGLHNNLIADYFKYGIEPEKNLTKILSELRSSGLKIYGSASHGSKIIRDLNSQLQHNDIFYTNYLIFKELFQEKMERNYEYSKLSNPRYNDVFLKLPHLSMMDFKLYYETYFVKNHYYISDTRRIFWYSGNDPIETVKLSKQNETTQLLLHPVWWKLDLQ